jgi:hypothetical protein
MAEPAAHGGGGITQIFLFPARNAFGARNLTFDALITQFSARGFLNLRMILRFAQDDTGRVPA